MNTIIRRIIAIVLVIISLCGVSYADDSPKYFQLVSSLSYIDGESSSIYDSSLLRTTLALSFLTDFCLNDLEPKFKQDDFVNRLTDGTLLVGRRKGKNKDFYYVGYYCDEAACAFNWIPPIDQAMYETFSGTKKQLREQVDEWMKLNTDEYVTITNDELATVLQILTK